MGKAGKHFIYGLILVFLVAFTDQYLKWTMLENTLRIDGEFLPFFEWFITIDRLEYFIAEREVFKTIELLPFLDLVVVWNQGISFGMFNTAEPVFAYIFAGISMIVAFFMLIWLALTRYLLLSIAIGFVAGGAIGNAIDRIRFGAVVDFIDLHYKAFHWPAFNFADIFITIGAAIMVYIILFMKDSPFETVDV